MKRAKTGAGFPRLWFAKSQHRFTIATLVVGLLALILMNFDEVRKSIASSTYSFLGLDRPRLVFEDIGINGQRFDDPFYGCPPGNYIAKQEQLINDLLGKSIEQDYIHLAPTHYVLFTVRETSQFTNDSITIKNVYIELDGFWEFNDITPRVSGECGGGVTEKIYRIDSSELKKALETKDLRAVSAQVDESNSEEFSYIRLLPGERGDYFRLLIPVELYGIVEFRLGISADYKGKRYEFRSRPLLIGNTEDAVRYYEEFQEDVFPTYQLNVD